MEDAIENRIRKLLKKDLQKLSSFHNFRDTPGWDSLKFAELVIALQTEFKMRLSPSEIAKLTDLSSTLEVIRSRINNLVK